MCMLVGGTSPLIASTYLPDACGRSDPAGLLAEQGPRAGELPTSEPGRKLLSTWHELVRRGDLFNDWTGIRARPLSETEQGPPMQR